MRRRLLLLLPLLGLSACGEARLTKRASLAPSNLATPVSEHSSPLSKEAGIVFQNQYATHVIGANGRSERWTDRRSGIDYAVTNSPCARIKRGGKDFPVTQASFKEGLLTLKFADPSVEAVLRVSTKSGYFLWEVLSLTGAGVDEFVFADVPMTLRGSPGEPFVAVALAQNLKTLVREVPQPLSRLSASCFPRFGFAGAQVALVGCPPADLRRIMQEVVKNAPDLPKSALGGPWALDAPAARGSYLFDFGHLNEETVNDWISLVESLGFTQIDFHGGRSFRFGDCRVNPEVFPRRREGFKAMIDKLHQAGISAGLHTYAFFIDKKTDYVTPVPDPRLASDKSFTLAEDIGADATTIPVNESTEASSAITGFFVRNSVTLRVEQELITYSEVAKAPPYAFTCCKRGAYGTQAAPHPRGAKADHLKECFGLFVPDPESTLLAEVAQRSADFYNECGFDMIYLDALDGEDILGGGENGWHYGSQFVFELAKRLHKPALMEMSTFHHHLWYVRSRMGAWDHPRRAEKEFIDLHLAANESNDRMFLPSNLGWWAVENWKGAQEERTFPDDIEYLCTKALATDGGLSLMGIEPKNAASMARLAPIFKRYETLRRSRQVPESMKQKLRAPGAEFRLVDLPGGRWEFRPTRYDQHKVESLEGRDNAWTVTNTFGRQPPRLRIETLMAVESYDSPTNVVLTDVANAGSFTNHGSAPGLSSEVTTLQEGWPQAAADSVTLRFSATNGSTSVRGSWAKAERTFSPPLNLAGHQGLGLWVHGDGQGEILNIQFRSPEHVVAGIGDHYVAIDFSGWRLVQLVEPESRRWAQYSWPYGDPYSIYRESVSFSQISSISLWFNNIPPGRAVTCRLGPIKAIPLAKVALNHPEIKIRGKPMRFPVELEPGSYLELNSASGFAVYGPKGELKLEGKSEGELPLLEPGPNLVEFSCENQAGSNPRAKITIMSEGPPLR